MDAAGGGQEERRNIGLRRGYGVASLVLIGLYPVMPDVWRGIDLVALGAAAVLSVMHGRRAVRPDQRRPWTVLLWALVLLMVSNGIVLLPDAAAIAAGRLVDAAGDLLILIAVLALIVRRGAADLGTVIDAAVIALAAGSLLWAVLPHRLGQDQSAAAQANLFVVVFTLTGVLGALVRLAQTTAEAVAAMWWLLAAVGLGIAGNIALAIAGDDRVLQGLSTMLFMGGFTAIGQFGLDPSAARLTYPEAPPRERISAGRLAFLFVAVAVVPVVIGVRELTDGDLGGLLLAGQGMLIALLVMSRIGLLSAQRARAERALAYQATHDPLTLLPNRQEFVTRLRDELARGTRCVLLFCDIDNFKSINDTYGHDVGDQLLVEAASRLRTSVRAGDLVGRFGGDEFVVLLIDATPDDGEAAQVRIAATMARPFDATGGGGIRLSVGRTDTDQHRDPDQLIRAADLAMYRVKAARRSGAAPA